jgi:hypothetical protein
MAYLALSPVSAALYGKLNVSGLTNLATLYGDALPQAPALPCVHFEVMERDVRGFGGGGMPEVAVRVHVYSAYSGFKEGQAIAAKVIELLRDQSLTVTGYRQGGTVFYDDTVLLSDELVNGVVCHEIAINFRIYVEES